MGRAKRLPYRFFALAAAIVLGGGLFAVPGALAQQDGEQKPAGEQVDLEVERTAYWNNPSARALPDILVSEFPPGVACIVVPETCGEQLQGVTGPIDENRPKEEEVPGAPAQPVAPDTLPVARNGGELKYVSAFQFPVPESPEGQEIASFTLVLKEAGPTASWNSPATRQAVLAALVGVQTEDPQAAAAEAQKIVQNPDTYPPVQDQVLEVEACPVIGDWEAGEAKDWETIPERDCIFGATGTRQENGEWHFDLTLAAQSMESGELENKGIFIGPVAAANFAFGDKETTDNAQASYGSEGENAPFAFIEYQEALDGAAAPTLDLGGGGAGAPAASGSAGTTGSGLSSGSSGGQSAEVFSSTPSFESQDSPAPAPEVAPGEPAAQAAPPAGEELPAQAAAFDGPVTPWWVWLLVPIGLGMMYVLSRSLTAEAVAATGERTGAMTRLIEQRRRDGDLRNPIAQV